MYRLIHALRFELETDDGTLRELIVNLDRQGNGRFCQPDPPKQRAIELRVGDTFRHPNGRYRIKGIRTFSEWKVSAEQLGQFKDGYPIRLEQQTGMQECGRSVKY